MVVPELPQLRRESGVESRPLRIVTVFPSVTRVMSVPTCRSTRAVDFTSSPARMPVISLVPLASAANISARWEM